MGKSAAGHELAALVMSLIVVLQNRSGLAPVSDYTYRVLVGDGSPRSRTIAAGTIVQHRRTDGWKALVQRVLAESIDDAT